QSDERGRADGDVGDPRVLERPLRVEAVEAPAPADLARVDRVVVQLPDRLEDGEVDDEHRGDGECGGPTENAPVRVHAVDYPARSARGRGSRTLDALLRGDDELVEDALGLGLVAEIED